MKGLRRIGQYAHVDILKLCWITESFAKRKHNFLAPKPHFTIIFDTNIYICICNILNTFIGYKQQKLQKLKMTVPRKIQQYWLGENPHIWYNSYFVTVVVLFVDCAVDIIYTRFFKSAKTILVVLLTAFNRF